jgi:hypothetical protein
MRWTLACLRHVKIRFLLLRHGQLSRYFSLLCKALPNSLRALKVLIFNLCVWSILCSIWWSRRKKPPAYTRLCILLVSDRILRIAAPNNNIFWQGTASWLKICKSAVRSNMLYLLLLGLEWNIVWVVKLLSLLGNSWRECRREILIVGTLNIVLWEVHRGTYLRELVPIEVLELVVDKLRLGVTFKT